MPRLAPGRCGGAGSQEGRARMAPFTVEVSGRPANAFSEEGCGAAGELRAPAIGPDLLDFEEEGGRPVWDGEEEFTPREAHAAQAVRWYPRLVPLHRCVGRKATASGAPPSRPAELSAAAVHSRGLNSYCQGLECPTAQHGSGWRGRATISPSGSCPPRKRSIQSSAVNRATPGELSSLTISRRELA